MQKISGGNAKTSRKKSLYQTPPYLIRHPNSTGTGTEVHPIRGLLEENHMGYNQRFVSSDENSLRFKAQGHGRVILILMKVGISNFYMVTRCKKSQECVKKTRNMQSCAPLKRQKRRKNRKRFSIEMCLQKLHSTPQNQRLAT